MPFFDIRMEQFMIAIANRQFKILVVKRVATSIECLDGFTIQIKDRS